MDNFQINLMINENKLTALKTTSLNRVKIRGKQQVKDFKLPLLLTFLHIPLGILIYRINGLAVIHQLAVLSLGLYLASRKREKLEKVAYVAAYLIGVEVLWRMGLSSIIWEFGKYAAGLIMIIALVQRGFTKIPKLPLLYIAFLLPACLLTVFTESLSSSKAKISFNMSGPFLIFVSCWFFSHLKVNMIQLKYLLLSIAIPMISVAITTLFFTVTAKDIKFTDESNFATSGGFGPNQVSSALGLGVFVCVMCFLIFKNSTKDSIYLAILTLLFTMQTVMTFSRGGIYNAVGAILVAVFFQMKNLGEGVKKVLPVVLIGGLFLLLVFPYLNDFTGGKLQERFEDTDPTHRSEIIEADYQVFLENPVLGIGIGKAPAARAEFSDRARATHTEFSRIVSEHGILGVFSLIALLFISINTLRRQNSATGRALVGAAIVWSILYMINASMRLAAPGFVWGMCFITILNFQTRKFKKIIKPNRNNRKPIL
ncbi:MAG: O-antigen ligase family protein [Acidobacteriota bacterium]